MEFNDAMGVGDVGEWLIEKGFSTDIQEAFKSTFLCDYIFLCVECDHMSEQCDHGGKHYST